MASAGLSSGRAAFPFLIVVIAPYLCLTWRVAVHRVVCNGWLYVGRCSWCWSIQLLSKVFYPSLQLFLCCCERGAVFVLQWLVCLLELVRQLRGDHIQFSQVSLSCSFFSLFGQVVIVVSFIFSDAFLNFFICCCVVLLSFFCCSSPAFVLCCFLCLPHIQFPHGINRDPLFVVSISSAQDFLACFSPYFLDVLPFYLDVCIIVF